VNVRVAFLNITIVAFQVLFSFELGLGASESREPKESQSDSNFLKIPRDSLVLDLARRSNSYGSEEDSFNFFHVIRRESMDSVCWSDVIKTNPGAELIFSTELVSSRGRYEVNFLVSSGGKTKLLRWAKMPYGADREGNKNGIRTKRLHFVRNISANSLDSCRCILESTLHFSSLNSIPDISKYYDSTANVLTSDRSFLIVSYCDLSGTCKSIMIANTGRNSLTRKASILELCDFLSTYSFDLNKSSKKLD
jgi:hypothetical protein